MTANGITAIIWDYDGTLVDTMHKNLVVTRVIIEKITGKDPLSFPALTSLESYAKANTISMNWREMYRREYGMTEAQMDEAGALWPQYQIKDKTLCPPYPGIINTLNTLEKYPAGIFSQNSKQLIDDWLLRHDMTPFFKSVIGYEEVTFANQKPSPYGLFLSIKTLTANKPGTVIFIGDLETDIICAQNARRKFQLNGADIDVISMAINHNDGVLIKDWQTKPDYHLTDISQLPEIIQQLENER